MHIPVLSKEITELLQVGNGGNFIDCTAGGGGHIKAVLEKSPQAKVLGIDWDQTSLAKLQAEFSQKGLDQNVKLVSGNYADLKQIAAKNKFVPADAVLLDLGFSSLQIDDAARGFSFQKPGPLDMRYDRERELTAEKVVNGYPEKKLAEIFKKYGEDNYGFQIARAIVRQREVSPIHDTGQVLVLIREALPKPIKHKAEDHARKIFQALRIEVNGELDNVQKVLPQAIEILKPKGRIAIISFHSLEDRIAKRFLQEQAKGCVCPPDFPTCVCDKTSNLRIITRKPVTASEQEASQNPRSIPAKLRVAEKI